MPDRSGGAQPSVLPNSSARVRTAPETAVTRSSAPSRSTASLRKAAVHDGSSPTTGTPAAAGSANVSTLRCNCFRAVSSCPVEIQVSPQHSRRSGIRTE
ncbi:hypothetical protein C1Y40_05205 [Mycobacterium talmoniae]|uniref:Uncharacterized protein n=1 Tax=Mycobacterium talmoniae TaxID=1858794 RepID=A0A2S8BD97_9MYCO|nr:hypothetical protein C1Y40_05205 [Mycobacterium talmoniae]